MDAYHLAAEIDRLIPLSSGATRRHLQAARRAALDIRQPITDHDLEALPNGSYKADPGCPGLVAKRTARAGVIWYHRTQSKGRDRLLRIGSYPDMSIAAARQAMADVREGTCTLGSLNVKAAEKRSHGATDVVRLSDLIEDFRPFVTEHRRPGTARAYLRALELFMEAFGDEPIEALAPSSVQDVLVDIEDERGPGAAKKTRDAIASTWKHAQGRTPGHKRRRADCLIGPDLPNPVAGVSYEPGPPKGPMAAREIDAYWVNLPHTGIRQVIQDALVVHALTGARIGEVCQLRQDWVNRTDGWIEVPGEAMKNGKPHKLCITRDVAEVLDRVPDGQEFVFQIGKGKHLPAGSVQKEFNRHLKQLGVYRDGKPAREQPNTHRVRASAYTWAQEAGVDQRVIDRWFAHSPPGLQKTYGGEAKIWDGVRAAVEAWEQRLLDAILRR